MKVEILAACLVFGVAVRYMMALSQGCLFIGRAISDNHSKTGFQDAVTPPLSASIAILLYISCAALVGFAFWREGVSVGVQAVLSLIFWMIVSGLALPKPNSGHWVRMVFKSLANRTANYVKAGDAMRAHAAEMLCKRIADQYAEALKAK